MGWMRDARKTRSFTHSGGVSTASLAWIDREVNRHKATDPKKREQQLWAIMRPSLYRQWKREKLHKEYGDPSEQTSQITHIAPSLPDMPDKEKIKQWMMRKRIDLKWLDAIYNKRVRVSRENFWKKHRQPHPLEQDYSFKRKKEIQFVNPPQEERSHDSTA